MNADSIWTGDSASPAAEVLLVSADGRLQLVGSRRAAEALVGPHAEVVDLRGGHVVPVRGRRSVRALTFP